MIIRRHYRACIQSLIPYKKEEQDQTITIIEEDTNNILQKALEADSAIVREKIKKYQCLTVALYQHKNMLFLYFEALKEELTPKQLFPQLSELLALWPEKEGMASWAYMYPIFYHAIPKSEEEWKRIEKKKRRGRIAYLLEDKLFSYIYYHKAIVEEGLLYGDKYQSIALHENILFSYFEEPRILTHIYSEVSQESQVIKDWLAADPASHFDHTLSGKDNFLLIQELFSMGWEDC